MRDGSRSWIVKSSIKILMLLKLEIVVSILDKESEMRKNWLKIPVFSAVLVLTASFVAQAQQSWKLNEGGLALL